MPELKQQVADIVRDMGHEPTPELVGNVYEQMTGDYLDGLCDKQEAVHGREKG